MTTIRENDLISRYIQIYNEYPQFVITAPGRINLIGEHTDYSDGFVLPVAINLGISIAMSPRNDRLVKVFSEDFKESIEFDLDNLKKTGDGWSEYIKGVAWSISKSGDALLGWQGVMAGKIPIGAGLSSSAALEMACVKAFCISSDLTLSPTSMALHGKNAEIQWIGVNVGIMDQLISANGKLGHALLLDCQSLAFEQIPIPDEIIFLVLDTMTRRELSHSDYNTRHEEVKMVSDLMGVPNLRSASLPLLEKHVNSMSQRLYQRARHVLTENERVLDFASAMRLGDLYKMGELINLSHASLRDDFEVSSDTLNAIVEIAQRQPQCLGARMTGAGFGGCALALITGKDADDFIAKVHHTYYSEMGLEPHIFKVGSSDGVKAVELSTLSLS